VLEAKIDPEADPEAVGQLLTRLDLRYVKIGDGALELRLNEAAVPAEKIRSHEAAKFASLVARIPAVRTWLNERQRDSRNLGIVVMEGRDIGTVIFPNARFKFFVTASPLVRAQRRLAQGEVPPGATVESVAIQIAERDHQDENRPIAPLKPAPDAIRIVTDDQTVEQVVNQIVAIVEGARH
jgi:cytidylate kinase